MSRYDGLIIPRSYSEYINKTDAATLSQALQLGGVLDSAPTEDSVNPVKSGGVFNALAGKQPTLTFDNTPTDGSTNPVKSGGIFAANAVIMANNKTLSGVAISAGSVVRVLFTEELTGSDATTGLQLTYNGNAYAVKVGKDGALKALTAHLVEESYIYLQAYTTLELAFDGSQFIVMGNPVVISNADFSIMADGSITYTKTKIDTTLGTQTDWTVLTEGVRYKIRNGVCTILIKLSNITFNNNGAYNIEEVLPQSASPAYEVLSPVVTYGLNGTFTYNETQTWISITPSGNIRFVGGIINRTVSNCLVCVSYTI